MGFLSELFAFIVVGDARYGREETPLDRMKTQADKGLEMYERMYERQDKGVDR